MKILVTGSSGFLGGALCPQLEAAGHEVVRLNSKNCDLTKQGSLDAYSKEKFDQIYHLAVWTQAGDFCLYHPGEQWIVNQQMNTNMLAWWQKHQPQAKLITPGTSCAYNPKHPLSEDYYLEGDPIESLFAYGHSKRMVYVGLISLRRQYGLRYLYLIPSTLYGPGYHAEGKQLHFIFDLIRKIVGGKLHGEKVVLWGDGHQKRELVLVEDFVRIMVQLAEKVDNEILNIGAGEEFSIRHFAKIICDKVEYDFEKIEFDTSRYVGATSKCLKTEKLKQVMPEYQLTSLEEGLEKTIEWYMAEHGKTVTV